MDKQMNDALKQTWQAQIRQIAARNPRLARALWQNRRVYFARFVNAYQQVANLPRKVRRKFLRQLATSVVGAAMVLALGLTGMPTHAAPLATITVDGICTLEDAITSANTGSQSGYCYDGTLGPDVIELQTDVALGGALPTIASDITLNGNGYTIDGGGSYQVLYVEAGGNLTVNDLTILGGSAPYGGGLYNKGTVVINQSTISGNTAERGGGIFNYGTLTVNSSTIWDNYALYYGGGLYNLSGTTTLNNSTVSGNAADVRGGGLYNYGATIVNNSTITGNRTYQEGGGGIYNASTGDLTLNRGLISGNEVPSGYSAEIQNSYGGIISADNFNVIGYLNDARSNISLGASDIKPAGALDTVLDTTLADNGGLTLTHALVTGSPAIDLAPTGVGGATDQRGYARDQDGNAIYSDHEGDAGAFEYAPASSAEARINGTECDLFDAIDAANTSSPKGACAAGNTGADTIVLLKDVVLTGSLPEVASVITLNGNGHSLSGANTYQVLVTQSSGNLTLNNVTVKDGYALYNNGGCLQNDGSLTLNNSLVTGCGATYYGGGIDNRGTLILNDSVVSNNTAGYYGGGIANNGTATLNLSSLSGNLAYLGGGGIFSGLSGTPSLTIKYSTVSNNSSPAGGGIELGYGTLILRGSTISSNTAVAYGGGIASFGSSVLIENSTLTGNTANNQGGGLYLGSGTMTLYRSLISGNHASTSGDEIYGNVTANYNVIGYGGSARSANFTPGYSDIIPAVSVALADILNPTLADNGGPTLTHALVAGSPALDAAPSGVCTSTTDQRGAVRSYGAGCDAGAVEVRETITWGDCTSGPVLSGSYIFNFAASGHTFTVEVNSASDLTCITIEEMGPGAGHLLGTPTIKNSNNWWHITGNNTAPFDLKLTMPAGFQPSSGDKVCRWNGEAWDCRTDSITNTHIVRNHVTAFSDWATSIQSPTAVTLQQFQALPPARKGLLAGLVGLVTLGLGMLGMRKKK